MLNDLNQDLYDKPVLTLIPAMMIFVTSIAFNVLDATRDLLDVRGGGGGEHREQAVAWRRAEEVPSIAAGTLQATLTVQ